MSSEKLKKMPFIGTLEAEMLKKKQEQESIIQRKKQIREQEKQLSKSQLQQQAEKKHQQEKEDKEKQLKEKRIELISLKQNLEKLKEEGLMEIGEAHKKALQEEEINKENQQLNQQKLKKFNQQSKERTKDAFVALNKEKYELGGYKQDIVKKKQEILELETKKAHENAEMFRTIQAQKKPEPEPEVLGFDQFDKTKSRKTYMKVIDLSKTCYHNPQVTRHSDSEDQIPAQLKAEQEIQKQEIRQIELSKTQTMNLQKQIERGRAAQQKVDDQKTLEKFNESLEKLKKEDQQRRISEGKQHPDQIQRPATILQNEIHKKDYIEQQFEKEFIGPKAAWAHEEITETQVTKNRQKSLELSKQQEKQLSKEKSQEKMHSNRFKSQSPSVSKKVRFEQDILEKKIKNKSASHVKIYQKPHLDTGIYGSHSKKNSASKSKSQENLRQSQENEQDISNQQKAASNIVSSAENTDSKSKEVDQQLQKEYPDYKKRYEDYINLKDQEISQENNEQPQPTNQEQAMNIQDMELQNQKPNYKMETVQEESQEDSLHQSSKFKQTISDKKSPGELNSSTEESFKRYYEQQQNQLKYIQEQEKFLRQLDQQKQSRKDEILKEDQKKMYNLQENYEDISSSDNQDLEVKQTAKFQHQIDGNYSNFQNKFKKKGSKDIVEQPQSNGEEEEGGEGEGEGEGEEREERQRQRQIAQQHQQRQHQQQQKQQQEQEGEGEGEEEQEQEQEKEKGNQNELEEQEENDSDKYDHNYQDDSSHKRKQIYTKIDNRLQKGSQNSSQYSPNQEEQSYSSNKNLASSDRAVQSQKMDFEKYKGGKMEYTQEELNRANQLLDKFLNQNKQVQSTKYVRNEDAGQLQDQISKDSLMSDSLQQSSKQIFQKSLAKPENFFVKSQESSQNDRENKFSQDKKFQVLSKNERSQSPNSELSYSISDMEKSAEKRLDAFAGIHQSGSMKKGGSRQKSPIENELDRHYTAKFGQNEHEILVQDQQMTKKPERMEIDMLNSEIAQGNSQAESLAEIFKRRKQGLVRKLEEAKEDVNQMKLSAKHQKTKEELIQIRKEMMKRPKLTEQLREQQQKDYGDIQEDEKEQQKSKKMVSFNEPGKSINEPNQELMERLALGKKVQVTKKDYLQLTNKNYELLPEIQRRKEEEKKKEEMKKNRENAKNLDKKLRLEKQQGNK